MAKPLAYSRWRRLPGVHRITEHRLPDHRDEAQRLTLFVPGWVLDEAERLSLQSGARSVQEYCEALLQQAIEQKTGRPSPSPSEPRFSGSLDLDEIASDLQGLAGWPAAQPSLNDFRSEPVYGALATRRTEGETEMAPEPSTTEPSEAIEVVMRHSGFSGEARDGLLPGLRRGEPIAPPQAEELLRALMTLEHEMRDESRIGRKLAYALHRLAFESQVLLTDAWPSLASDQATLDVLRMVQESVERVLSGEDVRYYVPETPGETGS